jgi:oligopeptide/dipeptide ABC transporter ATP-binding protein
VITEMAMVGGDAHPADGDVLLAVSDLNVTFVGRAGPSFAVRGVDITVPAGKTVGLVGESGSGKSVSMMAVMGLLPPNARVVGTVEWKGQDVTGRERIAGLRGREIAMIFQDPMTSLNPLMTVGDQIGETLRVHQRIGRRPVRARAEELLDLVGIAAPREVHDRYPHQLSGGMRQRVMIAAALAPEPDLLIADEPTTALDVTIQAQILDLLRTLQAQLGLAVLLITHDLAVVAEICEHVTVMYAGRAVEVGGVEQVLQDPRHPYTKGLLAASPRLHGPRQRMIPIAGAPPDSHAIVTGCAFAPRCPEADGHCAVEAPPMFDLTVGSRLRHVSCWRMTDAAD